MQMTMDKRARESKTESKRKETRETKENFSYFAPEAQSVELVGSFTNWEESPIGLKRSRDGTWKATVTLETGTYEYRFKVDGQWRNDPDCPKRMTNPYGEENCIREVR